MATLTIKKIPDDIYQRLKASAQRHRRSINSEVIVLLQQGVSIGPSAAEILTRARDLRRRMPGDRLTIAALDEAKRRGRP